MQREWHITLNRSTQRRDVPRSGTSRALEALAFDLQAPLSGGEGRTIRPRKGAGQDARHFSSGQEPRRKARPTLTDRPASSAGDATGCPFFGLLFFTPGILPFALRVGFAVRTCSCPCVGKQRKVTRPPAGGRNARRVGGQVAIKHQSGDIAKPQTEALDPCLRRGDGSFEALRQG